MNKITPFLWFNADAEEAAAFYLSIFPEGRRVNELRFPEGAPGRKGELLAMDLELQGQAVTFMNGGPGHPQTDAFSLVVRCEGQEEIDYYWSRLTEGGEESRCGWLKDRFGVSWQVVPVNLTKLLRYPAAMQAMMRMRKFDVAVLEQAAAQTGGVEGREGGGGM